MIFEFDNKYNWKNIYVFKIIFFCKKKKNIVEFYYKLLNGILSKNLNVSEWNKDVNFF